MGRGTGTTTGSTMIGSVTMFPRSRYLLHFFSNFGLEEFLFNSKACLIKNKSDMYFWLMWSNSYLGMLGWGNGYKLGNQVKSFHA